MRTVIDWKPQSEKQEAFHRANADEIFYGGAAGGGKTDALMREVLRQIDNPHYRAIMFRRTFPEVETSFIDKAYQWYEPIGLIPQDGGKVWYKPGGGKIRFAHLQHEKDVHKYQSAEFTVIAFDELTSFTEFQYDYLRSRNRTPDKTLQKYIISASNPGNIGHGWVRRRFIEPMPPNTYYKDENGLSRIFIPAKVYDNPILMDNDPDYVKRLESLPEKQRAALLLGSWDVFEGQFFTIWDRAVHVVEPYALDTRFKRFICYDYGYLAPACVHWAAVDFFGRVIFYRELYGPGYTYEQLGWKIAEMTPENERIRWIVHPRDMYKSSEETGVLALDLIKKGLYTNRQALSKAAHYPCNNERIPGWTIMRDAMKLRPHPEGQGMTAGVLWFNNCVNAVRTIPELIHDDTKVEDVDTDGEDHAGDCDRYGLDSVKAILVPASREQKPPEQIAKEELDKKWHALKRKKEKLRKLKHKQIYG